MRLAPLGQRLGRLDRLREVVLSYADAEDETDFALADDLLRKAGEAFGRMVRNDSIRRGMERAKANGVRLGRPSTVDDRQVADVAKVLGIRRAALALGVSKDAVWRAVRRCRGK